MRLISSLNPYSNGLPSRGIKGYYGNIPEIMGLNPYSNGLPSRGETWTSSIQEVVTVLIPILMDYPLGANVVLFDIILFQVLIPILMDYPLGGRWAKRYG